jgi:predicted kinase
MTLKRCVVFDIDGTLADCSHRTHFVNGSKKNWPAFMAGIPDDVPNFQVTFLNTLLNFARSQGATNMPIFLCSGRSENERSDTEAWLNKYSVTCDKMFMRKSGDYRADHIIKRELLEEIRADGYEPWLIFDDRQCVVDMWRKEGLFVLQCDPKQSHTDHVGFQFHSSIKWPLTILVGPSGSGKSTWIAGQSAKDTWKQSIIATDVIRENLCGNLEDQSKNEKVFATMHELATTRLRAGLPVVIDATNLRNADRIKCAKLVPSRVPVRYVVIDRSLDEKHKTAGWRKGVSVKGKPLIDFHDQVFKSNLKDILKGDNLPNVTVQDEREYALATVSD